MLSMSHIHATGLTSHLSWKSSVYFGARYPTTSSKLCSKMWKQPVSFNSYSSFSVNYNPKVTHSLNVFECFLCWLVLFGLHLSLGPLSIRGSDDCLKRKSLLASLGVWQKRQVVCKGKIIHPTLSMGSTVCRFSSFAFTGFDGAARHTLCNKLKDV